MMWFAGYFSKENVGTECRNHVSYILYGIKIMSFLYQAGMNIAGFRIYLLSGSLNASDLEKIKNLQNKELKVFDLPDKKILIAVTADGYLALCKSQISLDEISEIQEQEAYNMLFSNSDTKKKRNETSEN